jgi:opacity protein-like surface antigen
LIRTNTFFLAAALLTVTLAAGAQDSSSDVPEAPQTALSKQLSRVDLGISGAGLFNQTVTGKVEPKGGSAPNYGTELSDEQSNTAGVLINIRYTAKPLVGFEFNFVYARYVENFSYPAPAPFGVQTAADELTLGYLIQPNIDVFGLRPFASVGAGTTRFKPTPRGGEGLPEQARMTYYYNVGLQKDILPYLGLRIGFRENFFLAPDFGQNYLTNLQHTSSIEPNIGFYLRF